MTNTDCKEPTPLPRFAEMICGKSISTFRPDPVEAAADVGRR